MNKFRAEYQVIPTSALREAETQFDELMQEFDYKNPDITGKERTHEMSIRLRRSMATCAVLLGATGRMIDVSTMRCSSIGEEGIDEVPEAEFRGSLDLHLPTQKNEHDPLMGVSTVTYGIALSAKPDIRFFTAEAPEDSLSVVTHFSDIEELRLLRR